MARLAKERFLVLTADDSEGDCLMLRMVLGKTDRSHFIGAVSDGNELLRYMRGDGKYCDREKYPLPDKMLLDVALPQKDGSEVVEWLSGQPFDDMVVIVLSGSGPAQEVGKQISPGADGFPAQNEHGFRRQNLVKLLEEYLSQK
jgi:CheY-like chemotaxis protein